MECKQWGQLAQYVRLEPPPDGGASAKATPPDVTSVQDKDDTSHLAGAMSATNSVPEVTAHIDPDVTSLLAGIHIVDKSSAPFLDDVKIPNENSDAAASDGQNAPSGAAEQIEVAEREKKTDIELNNSALQIDEVIF